MIGHLCKEEARRYWEEKVVKDGRPLAFEDVYNMWGVYVLDGGDIPDL